MFSLPMRVFTLSLLAALLCALPDPACAFQQQQHGRTITLPATHVALDDGATPWHDAVRSALRRLPIRGKPLVADSLDAELRIAIALTVYPDSAVALVIGRRAPGGPCISRSRHARDNPDALARAVRRAVERSIGEFRRLDRLRLPNGCEVMAE